MLNKTSIKDTKENISKMQISINNRINRIRKRYQTGQVYISIERAKYYTENWKETEGKDVSLSMRVALAMKNVYKKMTHYIDPNDYIAGNWTEFFLGIPIDIERGVFNKVFKNELDKSSLLYSRILSILKILLYIIRKRSIISIIRNYKMSNSSDKVASLDFSLKTMSKRKINSFQIKDADKKYLKNKLIPYWKGKSIIDIVRKELKKQDNISKDLYKYTSALIGENSCQFLMVSTCSTINSFQGHVILDYEKVLSKGLYRIKKDIQNKYKDNHKLNDTELDFLKSIETAVDGIIIYSTRLADKIKQEIQKETNLNMQEKLKRMSDICLKVPFKPAKTFEQAVQSIWTIKTAVELAHPFNLHSFGRLDQILYPYYKQDIQTGLITQEKAKEILEELMLKIMSHNLKPESNIFANFYHRYFGSSPVTIGGVKPNGEDATNELTSLFIDASKHSKAVINIALRVHNKTPDDILLKLADVLYNGTSSFAIYNDQVNIESMKNKNFSEEDARNYAVMGCVEMTCPGKTGGMSGGALSLCRLLDITLNNGDSKTLIGSIKNDGLKLGKPDSFSSFEEFISTFIKQAKYMIKKIVDASNIRDKIFAKYLPAPFISAFIDGCLDKKKDVTIGGGKYDISGISMINSIANLIDSLYVIKILIFREKKYTFNEFIKAVKNNFVGYENLYKDIKELPGKWGNGNRETDELAQKIMKELFQDTYNYTSFRGGVFVGYVISMVTHTLEGNISSATLDGRKANTPFAASCSPYNVEKSGVTGVLRSVAQLPFEDIMGAAVNVKFHQSAIGKDINARKKWIALIRSYFELGGSQIQPTVANARILRHAQQEPKKYQDLIVKVGGYSTYFVDLGKEIQEEIIMRTEHK